MGAHIKSAFSLFLVENETIVGGYSFSSMMLEVSVYVCKDEGDGGHL